MAKVSFREVYEAHVGGMLEKVWDREGETLTYNPVDLRTPLCEVMGAEDSDRVSDETQLPLDEEHLAEMDCEQLMAVVLELKADRDHTRARTLHVVLNFLFGDGPEPLKVSERAFILARALGPNNVWNMEQWEAGAMHGLIRQTWQQMEKRLIEEMAARLSSTSAFTLAGGKSYAARERYSREKKGNTSRKLGRRQGEMPRDGFYTTSDTKRKSKRKTT